MIFILKVLIKIHIDNTEYPPALGHHWHLWFWDLFPMLSFTGLLTWPVVMSAFLVRKNITVPDPLPTLTAEEVWMQKDDTMFEIKERTNLSTFMVRVCWFVKAWLSSSSAKSRSLLGEERERIPELVSWRGQQQDWREGQGPGRQYLHPVPSEGRQGWPAEHQQGNSLACPAVGYGLPSIDGSSSTLTLCGKRLKRSKLSHKKTLKEKGPVNKIRYPTAYTNDDGEQV